MMVRQMHQARVVWGTSAAPDQADSCDHAVKCQTAMIELRVLLLLIHRSSVLTSGTANACGWICARVRSSERQFRAERNLVSPKVTFFFRTWMQTPITSNSEGRAFKPGLRRGYRLTSLSSNCEKFRSTDIPKKGVACMETALAASGTIRASLLAASAHYKHVDLDRVGRNQQADRTLSQHVTFSQIDSDFCESAAQSIT